METIEVLSPIPQQFQQSPRLLSHSNDTEIDFANAIDHILQDDDDSVEILRGIVERLDVEGHEMFNKLVSKVEKHVPIERHMRKTLHDFRGKPASEKLGKFLKKLSKGGEGEGEDEGFTITERGANGDVLLDELKLGRFKVKTVNIPGSGVIMEEEGQ